MGVLSKVYAKIAKGLNDLLVGHPTGVIVQGKKNKNSSVPKICGPAQQSAFDTLMEILFYSSVLVYVDFKSPFCNSCINRRSRSCSISET